MTSLDLLRGPVEEARRRPPRLTDVGDFDHNGSVLQALPRLIRFFDETAKTT
ncbi:hypothetical protein ACIF6L_32330 [Kitasatospora sp. NPDC086009]|uniref:hypothetical protein n=1 Tax=Kitasatospora sp. NPDC086009 TaxID=3364065 RepID=UPI0037CCA790